MPGKRTPETPKWLVCLALLFIPGVYLVLLASAGIIAGVGGSLFWLLLKSRSFGMLKIAILCGLGMGTLLGIVSVIRGLLITVRPPLSSVPGLLVNRAREPALMHFVIQLCTKLNTLSPNNIIICAEPTFFVTQGKVLTLDGVAKGRILGIGLPFLGGLTVNELRVILAHEFAHFTGRDTLFSALVRPVYDGASTALDSMIMEIRREGEESRSLLEWLAFVVPTLIPRFMLQLHLFVFHCLNLHISKAMERRADAISASTCGSECYRKALMKTAGMDMVYHHESCGKIIRKVCPPEHARNHFRSFRVSLPYMVDLAKSLTAKAYAAQPDRWDTHPSLKARLDAAGDTEEQYQDKDPAISLFAQLEEYENALHEKLIGLQVTGRIGD